MMQVPKNYSDNINADLQVIDEWSLIQSGCFQKACVKSDKEYGETKRTYHLRNKLYALFHLSKYHECEILSSKLIELENGCTSVDFTFNGIAEWILNKHESAINTWKNGRNSLYKDAGGGIDIEVVLFFAAVKTGDKELLKESSNKLRRLLKAKKGNNWPKPLGHYLLGQIDEDQLVSSVSTIPILRERNLCQAYFAIAIKLLEKNDLKNYIEKLKDIISLGPHSYLEQLYYLSKGEISMFVTT